MWKAHAILALCLFSVANAKCPTYQNCADCLNTDPSLNLDCGWCSPDPAFFANGSTAFQCMDHTSQGWYCNNLYMHDGCVAGYVCDTSAGQCVLGNQGEGDTYDDCMTDCNKDPTPEQKYTCDTTSFQCVNATSGGSDSGTCDSNCGDETPSKLVGLWRGINVQSDFTMGEILMNFTEHDVTFGTYPLSDGSARVARVAMVGDSLIRLTFTSPASLVGAVKIVSYSSPGWPTGPESSGAVFAVPRDDSHQSAPSNVVFAMGDLDFDVYSMQQCNSWAGTCDFSPAFDASTSLKATSAFKARAKDDSCNGFADCDDCLAGGATCGWCDGTIVDTDGNTVCGEDGMGCCGGDDGFSTCDLKYRKTCPVMCDWTNWTNPSCRTATTPEVLSDDIQTASDCDAMPWCTAETYQYCDETGSQTCQTLYSKADCDAEPQCDSSNPTCDSDTCKKISYTWCSSTNGCQSTDDKDACEADPDCDPDTAEGSSCDPTKCVAETYYTCDADTYTCKMHTGPAPDPSFNTTDACEAACVNKDISGVWRGLRIDSGFQADEWDFKFAATAASGADSKSITFKSKATGVSYTGTYVVGSPITDKDYSGTAATITVTLTSGDVLTGIVSTDETESNAQGPVTKFMYLGLPKSSADTAASFSDGMTTEKQEWVLMACLDGLDMGCDFSKADPTAT